MDCQQEEEEEGKGEGGRKSSSSLVLLACTDALFFSDSRLRRHEDGPNASPPLFHCDLRLAILFEQLYDRYSRDRRARSSSLQIEFLASEPH